MSQQAKRRVLSFLGACAVGLVAVLTTFAFATASARTQVSKKSPLLGGFERQGRIWVKTAPKPAGLAAALASRSGYRNQGRLWIKDSPSGRQALGLGLDFTKTVGLDANVCATTDTIAVPSGSDVFYCFNVMNTGTVTFVSHTVVDDQLGTVLGPGFLFDLGPGGGAFFTVSQTIGTIDVLNTATWTALDAAGAPAADTDTALVTILQPSIALTKTVGLDPNLCASTDSISVLAGTEVYYCYFATNTGLVTLSLHDVVDDQLGTLLGPGFPFDFAPGGSVFFTVAATINSDVTNLATWTAYNPGPVDVAESTDTAEVTIMVPVELMGFEVD